MRRLDVAVILCATVLCSLGCRPEVRVSLTDTSVPPDAEWNELPEHVRAEYRAMATAEAPERPLDRPPHPVGGMAAIMRGVTNPEEARRAGLEGRVVVRALIDAERRVVAAQACPPVHPLLDGIAVAAVSRARFHPAIDAGAPTQACVRAPIRFKLVD